MTEKDEKTKEELLREISKLRHELGEFRKIRAEADETMELLHAVLDNTTSVIHIKDTGGRFLLVNRWFEKNTGFKRDEIIGRTPYDLYPKDIVDALLAADRRVIQTKAPFEVEEDIPLPGGVHTFISSKFPVFDSKGNVRAVCGVATDITERKRTEEALRRSEASLANAQRIARFGNWEWNVVKNEVFRSAEVYRILGRKKEDFPPTYEAFLEIVHPDDREFVMKSIERALHKGEPYSIDYRVLAPGGKTLLVHSQAEVVFDEIGNPVLMCGTFQDVTEFRENEKKYLDQLRFLEALIDTIPSPIFYKDSGGRYIRCNRAFEEALGVCREDFRGKTVYDVAPKALADKYRDMDQALFDNPGIQRYEGDVKYSDGTNHNIIFSKATYNDASGKVAGIVGVMTDVTDLRRALGEKDGIEARLRARKKEKNRKG